MDYLAASGLEPQLAIPVIVVVVGALLVYVFGFQKSEEPSLEHLAVLQSTSSYKARSVSNTKPKNVSAPSKAKEKPSQQNGHVVHDKERNGVAAKKKEVATSNKENKPPRTPQLATSSKKARQEVLRPEDFDSGEWIQAVSRKDKKKQVKKDEPKENNTESPKKTQQANKEEAEAVVERSEESVLKEAQVQVQIQNQTTQTTPKPSPEKKAKKAGKDASTTTTGSSGPSSQEPTPTKQKKPAVKEEVVPEKKAPEVVNVNGDAEEVKTSPETSPTKKQSISEETPVQNEGKGRVAFDEMGDQSVDAWEEAKSRGNKKRRARKD